MPRRNDTFLTLLFVCSLAPLATAQSTPDIPEGYSAVPYLSTKPERSFEAAEEVLEPGLDYGAIITTNKGPIQVDLFEADTPETVNSFVFLSLHHFYDGLTFHRVLEGFMAQGGDPEGDGTGGPGYSFGDEFVQGIHFDEPLRLAMANAGPATNTNGSQFFITFVPTPHLDGLHTIFGTLTAGEETLKSLQLIDPQRPDTILEPWRKLAYVKQQGIALNGDPEERLEHYLAEKLGKFPEVAESFTVDGFSGVIGQGQDEPLVGFYPKPDTIESVTIISKDKE
jgi:cyclophilin family peptidyl-prolyl cis-trans isomerase